MVATSGGLKQTADIALGLGKGALPARFPFPAPGISLGMQGCPRATESSKPIAAVNLLCSELLQELSVWHH